MKYKLQVISAAQSRPYLNIQISVIKEEEKVETSQCSLFRRFDRQVENKLFKLMLCAK